MIMKITHIIVSTLLTLSIHAWTYRCSGKTEQTLTTETAIAECKNHLQKLIIRYDLDLKPSEKESLLAVSKKIIHEKAEASDSSSHITKKTLLAIKKKLEQYCQSIYPEKFKASKSKKNKAICHEKPSNHQKPSVRSKREGTARISQKETQNIVLTRLNEKFAPADFKNTRDITPLLNKIMKKIKRHSNKGYIWPREVHAIIDQEITTYKNIKKKFSGDKTDKKQAAQAMEIAIIQMSE